LTGDTPFMLRISISLKDYLWRERTSPNDFKDRKNMENWWVKLVCMSISIHKGGVTYKILNQSSLKLWERPATLFLASSCMPTIRVNAHLMPC
jgi:hypothetical protein